MSRGDETSRLPKSRKTRALLAYLAVRGRPVTRERLCEIFWDIPDDPRASLRWSLTKLRPVLNVDDRVRLHADRDRVWVETASLEVDWLEIKAASAAGLEGVERATIEAWLEALEDGLLAGLDLPEQPAFQDWLTAIRIEGEAVATVLRHHLETLAAPAPRPARVTAAERKPATAVLPFGCASDDAGHRDLALGITEDLITALSRERAIPVIARDSSFAVARRDLPIGEVAVELGAHYVVGGHVRVAAGRVRATVELIDAQAGEPLWADKYDRALEDVFELQDAIVQRVVTSLVPTIEQAELRRITLSRARDLGAWEHYIRGVGLFHREDCETNALARDEFAAATRLDPSYARAWAHSAWTHVRDVDLRCSTDREASLDLAAEQASHAISLDAGCAMAFLALSTVHVWRGELLVGLAQARRALDMLPHYAHAAMAVGNRMDLVGDGHGGIAQMEAALRLNPRDPNGWHYFGFLARANGALGQHEKALTWALRATALRPADAMCRFRLAMCLANLDRVEEAREALAVCGRLADGLMEDLRDWQPYAAPERNTALFAGLRRHGLVPA